MALKGGGRGKVQQVAAVHLEIDYSTSARADKKKAGSEKG
jgi:hypothetical protein